MPMSRGCFTLRNFHAAAGVHYAKEAWPCSFHQIRNFGDASMPMGVVEIQPPSHIHVQNVVMEDADTPEAILVSATISPCGCSMDIRVPTANFDIFPGA